MELKIKTVDLQEMVGRAIKCTSNNKLIPLTSLMNIKVEKGMLTLTTTDATNYFYICKNNIPCEDFEISVMADLFTKLIQKTTADHTTLVINKDMQTLVVKGNGSYTMELPLDENGQVIRFPKKLNDSFRNVVGMIQLSTVKAILNYNKPSLATTIELPALTCYYCYNHVVTSDRFKICDTKIKLFDEPFLISPQLMDLLGVMSGENIDVTSSETDLVFSNGSETIYAPIVDGIETFPVDAVMSLVESEFGSSCKVSRVAVLDLLDRLSLFVSPYDKRAVRLTFTNEGIMFSSKQSSGVELVPYAEHTNFIDYTCMIDIEMFRSQVASQNADNIHLYYGSDIAIKMVCDNITQIVALAEDE